MSQRLSRKSTATTVRPHLTRIHILRNLTLVALGIITVRLFFIQIIEHDAWVARANDAHTLLETITAKRGEIYMMDGSEPVAVVLNQTTYSVVIDPSVTDKAELARVLDAHARDYQVANLDEVYSIEGLRYYVVARGVPYASAREIADEGLSSVWLIEGNERVYPEGEMGSTVLGFVNAEGLGQYGAEGAFNDLLSGKDGLLKTIADVNKIALSIGDDNVRIPAEDGENIVLSIDRGLERGVEEIASAAINSTAATNAAVLVMNPNNGEVLAMSSLPNYNPGDYSAVTDASAYVNQVTEVPYEPASICKSFAFSAAINDGKMTADTTYFNEGYEIIDGWKINNAEQRSMLYGTINMRTALYWSLNTGSIYALKLLGGDPNNITQAGRERLYDYYYNKFRLGRATGIELFEAEGYIPDPNEGWGRDSTYANITFGQNLGITMIQTASAWSAVVNGGVYHAPTVVKGVLRDGKIVPLEGADGSSDAVSAGDTGEREQYSEGPVGGYDRDGSSATPVTTGGGDCAPEEYCSARQDGGDRILTAETSAAMREMFIYNREYKVRGGIDQPGYDVGGKSGTAQVIVDGAYDESMNNLVGSYIGFVAPSGGMPSYVIMVKMWGAGQALSGTEAGELFDNLSRYVIDYMKVKPGN